MAEELGLLFQKDTLIHSLSPILAFPLLGRVDQGLVFYTYLVCENLSQCDFRVNSSTLPFCHSCFSFTFVQNAVLTNQGSFCHCKQLLFSACV